MELREIIKKAREDKSLTIEQVSEEAKIPAKLLEDFENGISGGNAEGSPMMKRLKEFLEVK